MATEAQLRRRMRELENEIESLRRQRESFQRQMTQQMERQMEEYKREFAQTLQRQKNETEELYTRRLRDFQEQMIKENQYQYEELRKSAEEVARKQEDKLKELSACNEELRSLMKEMRKHTVERDLSHRMNAEESLQQVEACKRDTNATPHEFFFRGEYDIIDSHANEIVDEIENEMYQAALADASSVMMEFQLLKTKVEQAFQEWMLAFQDYSRIIRELKQKLELLETQPIQTMAGRFQMKVSELDYWSSKTYLPFKEKVESALKTIEEIENQGVTAYLKQTKTVGRRAIFSSVSEAQRWRDELAGITNCILSERLFSDERFVIGREVSELLKENGYHVFKRGFKRATRNGREVEVPLDCYEVVETLQGRDMIRILLIPVREHGTTVKNECFVSMDAYTLRNQEFIDDVVETNVNRVKEVARDVVVHGAAPKKVQEKYQKKEEPSPMLQIQHLERKYK